MQNNNESATTLDGIPAGELAVLAAVSDEPKSRIEGIEEGTLVVSDDTDLQSNAAVKVAERGITVSTPRHDPADHPRNHAVRISAKPKVNVGAIGHLSRSGPARGRQVAAALGLALAAVSKTVADFPSAPEPRKRKFTKKHDELSGKHFKKSSGLQPNKAPKPNFGKKSFRSSNRGK
jgi:hypothetical protein